MSDIVLLFCLWALVLAPCLFAVNLRLRNERGGRPYGRLRTLPDHFAAPREPTE